MIRKLKILAPVLVAVLAMNALVASTAPAADVFTTSQENAWLTGNVNGTFKHIFLPNGPTVECTTAQTVGKFDKATGTVTVTTKYTGKIGVTPHGTSCTVKGGTEATISTNDCEYVLTGSTTGSDNGTDAIVWIQCPAGKEIELALTGGCTIKIPSQTSTSGGVTYTNLSSHSGGSAISITTTMTGITYSAPGFACSLGGLPSHGNGASLTGASTLTGYEYKGGTLTAPTEGAQIPISVS